jgi:uridine kinase
VSRDAAAIDLIAKHIQRMLTERSMRFRGELAGGAGVDVEDAALPPSVHVMPMTPQRRVMHTLIRDAGAARDDFVFYAERLCRLLLEEALGLLPFAPCTITTPNGATVAGLRQAHDVCAKEGHCGTAAYRGAVCVYMCVCVCMCVCVLWVGG